MTWLYFVFVQSVFVFVWFTLAMAMKAAMAPAHNWPAMAAGGSAALKHVQAIATFDEVGKYL
jgi:NADH:ubiquinone oxidoreductase subunit 4 (subunit M)